MALRVSCLSIVSLFSLSNGQTGEGCFYKTCSNPGQVRQNAVFNIAGDFIGGCNCGCPWELYDPANAQYCAAPNEVNFNPVTMLGDCSCGAPQPTEAPVPSPTQNYGQPIPFPAPLRPILPTVANFHATLQPILPRQPALPQFPLPGTPTSPAVPSPPTSTGLMEVLCDLKGPCSCPIGHAGRCTITCEGDPDACKDVVIECNNDGFPCIVNCFSPNACAGSASVMGPAGSSLTVNCLGEKSCEGSTSFNGEAGTDMTVICNGMTSCKGGQFNFGSAVSYIECNGEPDSCLGTVFNLPPNAINTPGAAYECVGAFCPEVGVAAPEPFSNVVEVPFGGCMDVGGCSCDPRANEPCQITCDGGPDACKDGIIACNSDGHACVIDCIAEQACSGAASLVGPKGASLTVNCYGPKSCEGSTVIEAADSTDVTVLCAGSEACKGSTEINFGRGMASVYCSGTPDACEGIIFNLLPGVETMPGAGFKCVGARCPVDAPLPFTNAGTIATTMNTQFTQIVTEPAVPVPSNPIPAGVVPSPTAPIAPPANAPAVPAPAATPGAATPAGSSYCCLTSIPDFKPWAGRCWDETTEVKCLAEANNRCRWDPLNCLPNPPVNSFKATACKFYDQMCVDASDCCSESCNPNGLCR